MGSPSPGVPLQEDGPPAETDRGAAALGDQRAVPGQRGAGGRLRPGPAAALIPGLAPRGPPAAKGHPLYPHPEVHLHTGESHTHEAQKTKLNLELSV